MKYYIAYGSNLNLEQMKYRCPGAKLIGTGVLKDYELQFKGMAHSAFATIAPKAGASVPVGVWQIHARHEFALDRYEGFPSHYFKENVKVEVDGKELDTMVYIMNLNARFGLPSDHYYGVVAQGYVDCGLDTEVLDQALEDSARQYYRQSMAQQSLFDDYPIDDGDEEDIDDEDGEDEGEDSGWQMYF